MATTIDELVVTLGLDPTEFSKGQAEALADFKKTQEAAKKTASQMESDGKQAARFYTNIKNEALSAIAVLIGAHDIQKFVGDTVTNLSAVGRIAQVMGQATPDVLAVSMAVERIGGNAQAAQQSMLGLSQALERYSRFGEGSLEFKRGLGMIGAGPQDTPLQVLQKFAAWSQGKKPQDVELIGQQVGLNQDLINLTIAGRKGFDASIAQSYKNGIPTDADIKKVQALQQAFGNLAQSLKFAGTELVVDIADPLSSLLNTVSHIIHDFPEATKVVVALVTALIALKSLRFAGGVGRSLLGLGGRGAAAEAVAGGGAAGAGGFPLLAATAGAYALQPDPQTGIPRAGLWGWDLGLATAGKLLGAGGTMGAGAGAGAGALVGGGPGGGGLLNRRLGGGGGPAGGGVDLSTLAGRSRAAQNILRAAGFSADQAKGIVAGLFAETAGTLSTTIKNPHSTAQGLAQWTRSSGRQALFRQVVGKDIKDASFSEQLQFVIYELQHGQRGALDAIRNSSGARGAAAAFIHNFEAPGTAGQALDMRTADRFLGSAASSGGTQVTIGSVVVNTKATDARSMARDVKTALATEIATNSNGGLN